MFGIIGGWFSGIALKIGKWMLDKGLAALVNAAADDVHEEELVDMLDNKVELTKSFTPDACVAAKARMARFGVLIQNKFQAQ